MLIFGKNSFFTSLGPGGKSAIMINVKICASFMKIHCGTPSNFSLYMSEILHTKFHILFTV